jgi:DNA-binding IclR family transcriptional regulator
LLSTYFAEAEGRTLDLNEIAQTNDIPILTTSRWIKHLQQRDIVATDRNAHPNIELTRSGLEKMEVMLEAIYNGPASEHVLD